MSVSAIEWSLSLCGVEPGAHVVLIQLANLADQKGACFPSRKWLAARLGVSVDTIDRRLKALEQAGLLTVESQLHDTGAQRVNRYVLSGGRTSAAVPEEGAAHLRPQGRTYAAGGSRISAEGTAAQRAAPINDTSLDTDDDDATGARARRPTWQQVVEEVDHHFLDPSKTLGLVTGGAEVDRWLRDGADLALDVVPVIKTICHRRLKAPVRSWDYFRAAVREATSLRLAAPDPIQPAAIEPARVVTLPARRMDRPRHDSLADAALRYLEDLS